MEFQVDTRKNKERSIRVGLDNQQVAVFVKTSFFIHNLKGQDSWADYQLKLPAPWTQFCYRLFHGETELANAKKKARMHAFEADRPLIRHQFVEFELNLQGLALRLVPEGRHALTYVLSNDTDEIGRLVSRSFQDQVNGAWEGDLQAPEGWTPPLAAFVAWLGREGRAFMS